MVFCVKLMNLTATNPYEDSVLVYFCVRSEPMTFHRFGPWEIMRKSSREQCRSHIGWSNDSEIHVITRLKRGLGHARQGHLLSELLSRTIDRKLPIVCGGENRGFLMFPLDSEMFPLTHRRSTDGVVVVSVSRGSERTWPPPCPPRRRWP